jgi:hypothetical protein
VRVSGRKEEGRSGSEEEQHNGFPGWKCRYEIGTWQTERNLGAKPKIIGLSSCASSFLGSSLFINLKFGSHALT